METPGLPVNYDAEMAVIGSCLLDRDAIVAIAPLISSDDLEAFYNPHHRAIYAAMLDLYGQRIPGDLVTLGDVLRRSGDLDAIGGIPGLVRFTDAVPTAMHVEYYARIVMEVWGDRLMIEAGSQIAAIGFSPADRSDKIAKAQKVYDRAMNRRQASNLITMDEATTSFLEQLERGGDVGYPTGYDELDRLLGGGLHRSDLVILAALTSGGKTALACQLALTFGKREQSVLYVSLEMKAPSLLARFAAIQTGIPIERIRQPSKFLDQESFQRVVDAAGRMSEYPIRIDDDFSATLADIRSRALAMHNETGSIGMVVVDYIGQINSPGVSEENRTREVSKFSRGLKALAGELNCPVLALAQFNRGASHRQGEVPRLSDLKETSSLEQDADVVLILHRPDLNNAAAARGICEVHIAKQRQGPLGKVSLSYEPDTGRFSNVSFRPVDGY